MRYSSTLGCLYYYDRVLYRWNICDPTMLFLLGFEAITSYNGSLSDTITISPYIYYESENIIKEFADFDIYDSIYEYLSKLGQVDDFERYLKFNCYGLKLALNEMTGTSSDRTIPLIFKNDNNKKLIDLSRIPSRLSTSEFSYNNGVLFRQAQYIKDIFEDAGYNDTLEGKLFNISSETSSYNENDLIYIQQYNNDIKSLHEEKLANSSIYKLLDYKAIYSYALGVLFGCHCIGYSNELIWHMNPIYWYYNLGKYKNLVSTAWYAFRFHYKYPLSDLQSICEIHNPDEGDIDKQKREYIELQDKYQSIQINKLWNFDRLSDKILSIIPGEQFCYIASITDNTTGPDISSNTTPIENAYTINLDPILYVSNDENKRGRYVDCKSDKPLEWLNITDDAIPSNGNKGIISEKADTDIIRYIGYNKVVIKQALSYKDDNNTIIYHSPENKHHFTTTGGLGWFNFDEKYSELTLTKRTFKELPTSSIFTDKYKERATDKPVIVYICNVYKNDETQNNNISLYCIFDDNYTPGTDDKNNTFKYILSEDYFNTYYNKINQQP